jgi:hypothetical protein
MKIKKKFGVMYSHTPCFMLASYLSYSSTLKMEATSSSETSVEFQGTTRRYIPEDRKLHSHGCENLNSYIPQPFAK